MNETNLTFYGVRGSYPAPHKNIGKFGGNTSSILFENNDNLIILDAGTGIINLGIFLKNERPHIKKLDIFITHFHMDHIQGLPFFEPLFDPDCRVTFYCHEPAGISFKDTMLSLVTPPISPISPKGIRAAIKFVTLNTWKPKTFFIDKDFSIDYIKEDNHPLSGVIVYKIKTGDKCVVYATDVESPDGFSPEHIAFINGADILIHDSQYHDYEYLAGENPKKGFGHSTVSMAAANAVRCNVKKLYLFHFNPAYSDEEIEALLVSAVKIFKNTFLSKELNKISIRR